MAKKARRRQEKYRCRPETIEDRSTAFPTLKEPRHQAVELLPLVEPEEVVSLVEDVQLGVWNRLVESQAVLDSFRGVPAPHDQGTYQLRYTLWRFDRHTDRRDQGEQGPNRQLTDCTTFGSLTRKWSASDARVPLVTAILPVPAAPALNGPERVHEQDPHDVFGVLVAELPLHT